MKKVLCLLLLIIFIPIVTLADSAGPAILGYDAVVINRNGAKNTDKYSEYPSYVIPYNTKVHVYDERYDSEISKYIAFVSIKIDKIDTTISILLSDIMPVKDEIIPKDIMGSDDSRIKKVDENVIIFETNGIKLSKGPAEVYGYYDEVIPYKTKLKATYAIISSEGESNSKSWFYIDDGKYKGWVDSTWESKYAIAKKYDSVFTVIDTKAVDEQDKYSYTIPAETVLDEVYYINKMNKFYINYNNQEGFVGVLKYNNQSYSYLYDFRYMFAVNGYLLTTKDTKITSIDGKVRGTVSLGEKIKVPYGNIDIVSGVYPTCLNDNKCYYYVNYNGVKGFIDSNNAIGLNGDNKITIALSKDVMVYSVDLYNNRYNDNENLTYANYKNLYKSDKKIKAGTSVTSFMKYEYNAFFNEDEVNEIWYLVKYDDGVGFIILTDEEIINKKEEDIKRIVDDQPKDDSKRSNINSINEILLFSIIGTIITSITVLITVKLINKPKEEMKNEEVVEQKEIKDESQKIEKKEEKRNVLKETVKKPDANKRNVTVKNKSKKKNKNSKNV